MTGTSGCIAYSPWFDGCGSGATFAVEIGARTVGSPDPGQLEIRVETKSTEDADSAATTLERVDVAGFWVPVPIVDSDPEYISSARYTGFKELVRFKYILSTISPAKFFSVHFRMLPPLWQANCLGCSIEQELAKDVQMES